MSSITTPSFTIVAQNHTGITVTSLDSSLRFWQGLLGGEVRYRRKMELGDGDNVVGVPGAVLEAALLSLPGGNLIELLEYTKPEDRKTLKPRACDVGSVHVALEVTGSEALIEKAEELGWRRAVGGGEALPRIRRGDGSEWSAVYIFGPDGETVELLLRLDMGGA